MPVKEGAEKVYGRIVGSMINRGHTQADAKKIADKATSKRGVNDKGLTPARAGNIKTKDQGPSEAQKQSPSPYGSNTYGGGIGTDAKTAPGSLTQQRVAPSSATAPGPGPGKSGEYWCTDPTTEKANV